MLKLIVYTYLAIRVKKKRKAVRTKIKQKGAEYVIYKCLLSYLK